MELRQLHYFIAVAEELHFSRAAEKLGITQPPLSQQIRALEQDVGARLFHRTNRRVELTDAGRAFLPEARQALGILDKAVTMAARIHRGESGELRLGLTGSAPFTEVFAKSIYAFRQRYPEVNLSLQEMNSIKQITALLEKKLHVAVIRPVAIPETLQVIELMQEPMVMAMPADHPMAKAHVGEAVSLKDFALDDFILFPRDSGIGMYDQIANLFKEAGFTPHIVQEAHQASTQIALVAAGLGVAILPALQQRIQLDNVVYRTLSDKGAHTAVWLVTRMDEHTNIVQAFLQIVRQTLKQIVGSI